MWFNALCHYGRFGAFGGRFGALGWVGLILNLVIWVVLIAALVAFIVWAIRRARVPAASYSGGQAAPGGQMTAKQILQARYARGEITREQYQQMLDDVS